MYGIELRFDSRSRYQGVCSRKLDIRYPVAKCVKKLVADDSTDDFF
jgi:hypothetical protein